MEGCGHVPYDRWRTRVKTVIHLRVPLKTRHLLTAQATTSFPRTLFGGVSVSWTVRTHASTTVPIHSLCVSVKPDDYSRSVPLTPRHYAGLSSVLPPRLLYETQQTNYNYCISAQLLPATQPLFTIHKSVNLRGCYYRPGNYLRFLY